MKTIHDYLAAHAHSKTNDEAFTYIEDNGEKALISFNDLHQRAQSIAQYLVTEFEPETKVVLLFPQGLEYIQAFLGCLYAGVVAVPLYPPSSEKHAGRVLTVIDDCKAILVLTSNVLKTKLEAALSPLPVVGFEQLIEPAPISLETAPTADQIAFLQYTSGSTGLPKGVMVSHGNIIANLKLLEEATSCSQEDVFCNWLPLFHDLGLVNTLLLPIYLGTHSIIMSPIRFMKRPLAWLAAITEYKASICGAPNFAFDHCIERIPPHKLAGIDLSSWRIAFNAAEPVDADTMLRFSDRFSRAGFKESALYPAYGMAEATVFITGGSHSKSYLAQPFSSDALQRGQAESSEGSDSEQILVAHGRVQTDHHLKIVSPETVTELPDGEVGEIWFAGPSLAQGYWNDAEKTKTSFGARLNNDPNAYLRTGDLGFIHQDELYISGRIKDVMIIKGHNYYPQDFEKLAYNACTGLKQNGAAAVDVNGKAVLLLEVSRSMQKEFDHNLAREIIQAAIFENFEVVLEDIVFLRAGRLNRTSSGKIQRSLIKARYQSEDLDCLYTFVKGQSAEGLPLQTDQVVVSVSKLEAELCALWQEVFGLESIGVEENFLNLGGHSLLAASLISQIQKKWDVEISIRSFFTANTVRKLAKVIENSSTHQLAEILPVSVSDPILTSFAQERLWLVNQIETDQAQYNLSFSLKLYGELNEAFLLKAFKTILTRHQALRTTYKEEDGQVFQRIQESFQFDIPVINLIELTTIGQKQKVAELTQEEAGRLFDLTQDLMLRVKLLKLNPQSHIILITLHHIAADGWSLGVLTKELNALYSAYVHGLETPLPPLNIQYTDYVYWQRDRLTESVLQNHLGYWKDQLSNLPVIHSLPLDHPRPPVQSYKGASVYHTLSEELQEGLHSLARKNDATLFMLLNAVFASFLSRYSGESDIVIGSPIANREQAELAPLIGFFINTLVFRSDLSADPTFLELLQQSKECTFAAQEHQQTPFEKLVDELQPERSLSHSPLFQVMLSFQNQEIESLNLPGLEVKRLQPINTVAQYDLTLILHERENGLDMEWQYATDLFTQSTIERMVGHFEVLLQGIIKSPQTQISQLSLLNNEQSTQLLKNWNDTASDYPQDKCIHELFEEQVESNPGAVATVFNKEKLSYAELNQRANQLAHYLVSQGVTPDSLVGICVERSLDMLVGVLAIMKSGGAYLPLDPSYPKARLKYMIEDSGAQWVITQKHLAEQFSVEQSSVKQVFCLDNESLCDELVQLDQSNLSKDNLGLKPNHLAYLIYTSGSTGKPKGVMLEHHNLTNFLSSMQVEPGMTKEDTLLAVTSLSFDIHALELYLPLIVGGGVVIASSENVLSPGDLEQLIDDHQVTCMQATPATWKMLVNNDWEPQRKLKVLCGGEALSADLKNDLLKREAIELWNMYGPTETAVWSATRRIEGDVSLGTPIANTQFYVLDPQLNPVPIGVVGELHIGGEGVARGYLNQSDLTAEKFIKNPFVGQPSTNPVDRLKNQIYKTGDLVRWLPDGTLEYLRRLDLQVKVRGHRIELEEIETGLQQHPDVKEAVVHVWTEGETSNLVAYVTGSTLEIEKDIQQTLTGFLETFLPGYMIPSAYLCLEKIPLTPNGKINRSALPKPEFKDESDYIPPQTETEKKLCQIWQQLLNIEVKEEQWISVTSNFFHLGGHSLLAARLVSQIRKQWNVEVPIRTLFTEQSIRKLAKVIDRSSISQTPQIVPVSTSEPIAISFDQQRLWLIDQIQQGSNQYNLCRGFQLSGKLDVAAMNFAFQSIVERHHVLRTTIRTTEAGEAIQVVCSDWDLSIPLLDLTDLTEEEQEQAVLRYLDEEASQPFDLSTDLMIRVKIFQFHEHSHALLVTMHHIAVDGWSEGIIINEFATLYRSFVKKEPNPLPDIKIQYTDYSHWQNNWLQGEVLEHNLQFWKERLQGIPEVHNLPLDHPRPAIQSYEGLSHHQLLSTDIRHGLNELARKYDATLFMVLNAAFAVLLSRYSNEDEIVVGTPVANRERAEVAPLVGFFVNTLILRTDLSDNPAFDALLQRSKEYLLGAYEHQQLPFEKLVDELQSDRSMSYSPLVQVKLALQNNELGRFELPDLLIKSIDEINSVSKLDLSLDVFEMDGEADESGLLFVWEYATSLFNTSTIEQMGRHFEVLLKAILDKPEAKVGELPILSPAEHQVLLCFDNPEMNNTDASFPKEKCIHELFEEQVERNPDAVAVIYSNGGTGISLSDEKITYGELNADANQVAHYLIEQGVKPDTLVGLCVERSLKMVIGLLGILKAGGAYVPIDPDYPEDRIEYILHDSGVEIVLTENDLLSELQLDEQQVLPLDEEIREALLGNYSTENIIKQDHPSGVPLCSNHLAYVLYTSGSAGQPKGVLIEHIGIVNLAKYLKSRFGHNSDSCVLQYYSFAFDAGAEDWIAALTSGGKLQLISNDDLLNLNVLTDIINKSKVTHLHVPPSVLSLLDPESLPSIKTVEIGGEKYSQELVDRWSKDKQFFNVYGPTEASISSSFKRCHLNDEVMSIGQSIPNVQYYVLDRHNGLCPVGVAGELCIGGVGVGRGYVNQPELTIEKFIPSPFSTQTSSGVASERLYRTGDLVRWIPGSNAEKTGVRSEPKFSGEIEFLGRIDQQVKIRGFRIELSEVESALLQHECLNEAVVVDRDIPKKLVAFVVRSEQQDNFPSLRSEELIESLRTHLKQSLPDYMMPAAFVVLEKLPLTSNGKVDRKLLLEFDVSAQLTTQKYVAPKTEIEKQLCEIWQSLLQVTKIGITENFFAIGGDSILSIQAVVRAEKEGLIFTTRQLFECQTIEKLAPQVNAKLTVLAPQSSISGEQILTPSQLDLLSTDLVDKHDHKQSVLLTLPKNFSLDALQKIVFALYQRHDVLRLSVSGDEAHYIPLTDQLVERAIQCLDLGQLQGEAWQFALVKLETEIRRDLSPVDANVFRAALIAGNDGHDRLLLTIHSLLIDAVSWTVLLKDFAIGLEQWERKQSIQLPPKTSSFQQLGQFLQKYSSSDALQKEKDYWLKQAAVVVSPLPVDHNSVEENRTVVLERVSIKLSETETQTLLNDCASAYRTQVSDLLLSALYLALNSWTKLTVFRIDLETSGRDIFNDVLDLTETVGRFTSTCPVIVSVEPETSIDVIIKTVKEQLRAVPGDGIGFGLLRNFTKDDAICQAYPQEYSEIVFNNLGQFDQPVNIERVDISSRGQHCQMLELNCMVMNGQLEFSLNYNGLQYNKETMNSLARGVESALLQIINHCQSEEAGCVTPSDFPLTEVTQTQLDDWFQDYPSLEKLYPTTGMQQGMLFHSSLEASAYVSQLSLMLAGKLDSVAFKHALNEIVRCHDVYRTVFTDDYTHQLVLSETNLNFTQLDWSEYNESEQQQRLAELIRQDKAQGFDVKKAPLMRITLVGLSEEKNCLIWSNHHALSDGWSLPLVFNDVMSVYVEASRGTTGQPSESRLSSVMPKAQPYESYIAWLQQQDGEKARSYWKDTLASIETPTQITVDKVADGQLQGARKQRLTLTQEKSEQLRSLAKHHQVTLNTVIQAAWAYLLHRYSGEEQVVFGETVSGRPAEIKGVEHMVGLFINSLPVLVNIELEQEIGSWLRTLHQASIDRAEYGFLPLPEIQNLSPASNNGGRERNLFDTLVIFENFPFDQEIEKIVAGSGLSVTDIKNEDQTNYALTLTALPESTDLYGTLSFELGYRAERFEEGTITRILEHLELIATGLLDHTRKTVAELSILTAEEERQLLVEFNNTQADYPSAKCIHQLFAEQVKLNPEKIAVRYEDPDTGLKQLSYQELYNKSQDLALYLQSLGVKEDSLVGLCVERSLEMMVGILGILQAGGAYVPLDPDYPDERLTYMLNDSQVNIVLSQEKFKERFSTLTPKNTELVALDRQWSEIHECVANLRSNKVIPRHEVKPDHLAYVIYTSGSTGKPKGVMVEHKALMNRIYWMQQQYSLNTEDVVLQKTPFSFDVSVWEFVWPMMSGASVVFAKPEGHKDAQYLEDLINKEKVTTLHFVPSMFNVYLKHAKTSCSSIKQIFCSGEALDSKSVNDYKTKFPQALLHNLYGPTEAAIDVTAYDCSQLDSSLVPIGAPIANTQIYILDKENNPVPIGVPGELHIAGDGLGRGYLNRPELTEEKFTPNPFNPGTRMYKSGDLARWLGDGNIEYLGRIDTQVKIRGFRIELGEIEVQLNQHPEIKDSVVIALEQEGNKQLVAYYVAIGTKEEQMINLANEDLRAYLQQTLPDYMLPTTFVSLDSIPLTPNGKVNRRALEGMDLILESKQVYLAPRNDIEKQLVAIWAEVLNLEPEKIGINDSFFELGGHSLLATQVITKIRGQLAIDLPIKALFEQDSIAGFSGLVLKTEKSMLSKILPISRTELAEQGIGSLPLSFVQERLWFIDQLDPNSAGYNIPGAVTIKSDGSRPMNVSRVEKAINLIIARHESLRTFFPSVDGKVQQVILDRFDFKLQCIDLSGTENEEIRNQKAQELCQTEASTPFDLNQGPLIRGKMIKLTENEHVLALNMHHIISDGWSMGIIIKEFRLIVEAFDQGRIPVLPSLPVQYLDYSIWQRKVMEESELLQNQIAYWQEKLAGVEDRLNLATDYPRPSTPTFDGATEVFSLDAELSNELNLLTQTLGSTLYMTLQTAFKALLYRYTGQQDICFGGSIANRQHEETEGLIGMFANTLVFRDIVDDDDSFTALLAKVKTTCLEAYERQDTPFEKIVDLVQPERTIGISPLFQIMFVLHNVPMDLSEEYIQDYPLDINFSRFDLIVHFTESPEGLDGIIVYKTALFKPQTIKRMVKHFIALCKSIVAEPATKISELEFIDVAEKQQLLIDYNNTQADYPKDKCIHQLFNEQVATNPDKTALVQVGSDNVGSTALSYQQLYDKSHELALYLQSLGVKPDSLVGLCVGRSNEMMVGILGILQAGGAYVPLDPDYPDDRLAYMLEDSQATIVLTLETFKDKLKALVKQNTKIIVLDQPDGFAPGFTTNVKSKELKLRNEVQPDNLAYVMYTSGSTGQPKGVMIEHRMVIDYCYSISKKMDLHHCETFAAVSSFSSDLGNIALYVPIIFSKTLYLFSNYHVNHPIRLKDYFDNHPIDCMKITPSHFEMFKISDAEILPVSKVLIFAGEPLPKHMVDTVNTLNPSCKVYNNYGPTETTISKVSSSALNSSDISSIYLGKPLNNTQIYILDRYNQPQPIGVPGELHIAGDGVARGYLNRPELTAEKFIRNPFNPDTRMYKSGDRARWLGDGNIEYLGRIDNQVKIRGFRIEPGEIETVLNQHPEIKNNIVVAQSHENNGGATQKQLIAFYIANTSEATIVSDNLEEHLLQTLPEYMLPLAFVELEAIPLMSNGKVDRRALEQMNISLTSGQVYIAPRSEIEEQLVAIWSEVLQVEPEKIGVNDDFFSLGGHSLLAVMLVAKIGRELEISLPLEVLFNLKTIAGTAEFINATLNQPEEPMDADENEFVEGTL